ncbi:MAG: hypothetical protein ABEH38_01990 [Flavobacteriales bacterium]
METDLDKRFQDTIEELSQQFGEELDMKGVLFLIGVEELGKGPQRFKKDDKINLMHVAICKLLEPYGYYSYKGLDQDGWPHFTFDDQLPRLSAEQQDRLIKEAIIEYFEQRGIK